MRTSVTGCERSVRAAMRAVTLVELLVVVAILGVAAGLIVPRIGRSTGGQELREAAVRLAHTARTVRELAVSTQKTCGIEINMERGMYTVVMPSDKEPSKGLQAVQVSWLDPQRLPATVRIAEFRRLTASSESDSSRRVEFLPDGTSTGASIRLAGDAGECEIVVQAHDGRVVLVDAERHGAPVEPYDLGD